ncbi:prepilin-type N- cleavage/methylation domain protein [Treponema primitia ZAS-2]|uniref:Prepilin-type N-cleavage/methylation domain protein n=1 Tax=Treponema primitia (strain ATCC BAA-887 / DSM 12427 / ZAS-2) TaxID=545694 RepID=F5YQP9_TREPZ|nr:prepilin-type N-terminal cleavage/methylation domain-containing protein [Treponema primitia]AEF87015.1 prepilin-type N- cleavage/methylation domain protein [Treponema primitia ZAS-2]
MGTRDEGGFTLLETLAAMGILSILVCLIALSLSSSLATLGRSRNRLIFAVKLLKADALIRSRVNGIAIPYWETPSLEDGGSSLAIPWYKGEKESFLRIKAEEGRLILETDDGKKTETLTLLNDIESVELSLLRNDYDMPWGIAVTYIYKQQNYHTWAAFSSIPLGRDAP